GLGSILPPSFLTWLRSSSRRCLTSCLRSSSYRPGRIGVSGGSKTRYVPASAGAAPARHAASTSTNERPRMTVPSRGTPPEGSLYGAGGGGKKTGARAGVGRPAGPARRSPGSAAAGVLGLDDQLQLLAQVLGQVGPLEDEQGEAGLDDRAVAVVAGGEVAVGLLHGQHLTDGPGVPVLAADGLQAVQHADALQRPQEVEAAVVAALVEVADELGEVREALLDHRVGGVLLLAALAGGGQAVADRQAEQAGAGHGRRAPLALLRRVVVLPAA